MKSQRQSMTVYLGGGSRHLDEDMPFYRKIMDVVHRNAHVLVYDWVNPAFSHRNEIDYSEFDWKGILQNNLEAIARADLVVIEGTWYGFAEGYFTMVALQQKKPVLCVMRNTELEGRIVSGITDKLFTLKSYSSEQELEKIVDKFIHENTLTSRDLRFNFFIDNEIYNHLRWASFKTGKTKAEIIRELIEKEIDKNSN